MHLFVANLSIAVVHVGDSRLSAGVVTAFERIGRRNTYIALHRALYRALHLLCCFSLSWRVSTYALSYGRSSIIRSVHRSRHDSRHLGT